MIDFSAYAIALAAAALLAVTTWAVSLPTRDTSLVDRIWSVFFAVILGVYCLQLEVLSERAWLLIALVAVWATRLCLYITVRNWGHGEDRRYQAIRARNQPHYEFKSLYLVFGFQALLAWIIAAPLVAGAGGSQPLGLLDYAGVALWVIGMFFEVVGDWQMARFQADENNQGKVMDRGLWRFTRHPNYFGECALWWGYFLIACAAGAWWTVYAPAIMTLFLLKVSGVALLEKDISDRRPKYRDYIKRTSAFIPWPPKAEKNHNEVTA